MMLMGKVLLQRTPTESRVGRVAVMRWSEVVIEARRGEAREVTLFFLGLLGTCWAPSLVGFPSVWSVVTPERKAILHPTAHRRRCTLVQLLEVSLLMLLLHLPPRPPPLTMTMTR